MCRWGSDLKSRNKRITLIRPEDYLNRQGFCERPVGSLPTSTNLAYIAEMTKPGTADL